MKDSIAESQLKRQVQLVEALQRLMLEVAVMPTKRQATESRHNRNRENFAAWRNQIESYGMSNLPDLIRTCLSLENFYNFIILHSRDHAERQAYIRNSFKAFWDSIDQSLRPKDRRIYLPTMASSTWTGRSSAREIRARVLAYAPVALELIDNLANALEQGRANDPATHDAISALRELHGAIGEMLQLAEARQPIGAAKRAFEKHRDRIISSIRDGAQLLVVAPVQAVAASHVISLLSGVNVDSGMLSALGAAAVGREALLSIAAKKRAP